MACASTSQRRAHWTAVKIAEFLLHWARVSRFWPVRRMTLECVRRLHGQRCGVRVRDRATIDLLRVPAQGQRRGLPVVFAHGWLETKEFHLREARLLAEHGHDVILIDLRRHGRSTGHCVTFGVKEKHDVADVIDHGQRHGWIDERVITMGYSLGAATMLQHSAIDSRVAAVVALAPFINLIEAVRSFHEAHKAPIGRSFLVGGFERACRNYGFAMSDASSVDAVRRLTVPALFIVGERDRLLPDSLHTRVLAEAKTRGRCEYLRVPRAGHLSLGLRRWPDVDRAIVDFCAEVSQQGPVDRAPPAHTPQPTYRRGRHDDSRQSIS